MEQSNTHRRQHPTRPNASSTAPNPTKRKQHREPMARRGSEGADVDLLDAGGGHTGDDKLQAGDVEGVPFRWESFGV